MRATVAKVLERIEEIKTSPEAAELRAFDKRLGRILGYGQALCAAAASVFIGAIGWLLLQHSEGWLAFAAGGVTAALVLLMLGRARRALLRPQTISELVADDIVKRAKPLERVLRIAVRLRGGQAPKA